MTFDIQINQISCGKDHTAFVTPIGVYTMGSNSHGKLGIGLRDVDYVSTPHIVKNIQMYEWIQVSWGWEHTAAVMKSGDFYVWGSSKYGTIGETVKEDAYNPIKFRFKIGNNNNEQRHFESNPKNLRIKAVSCGPKFTCAIDSKISQ